ncbi:MAG: hypothetical protein ACI9EW_003591, partial [Cellvibrionaceae bacterium]
MRAIDKLFTELRQKDIRLWLDGGDGDGDEDLRFNAPPGALAGPLLAELKLRKAEVVAFLQANGPANLANKKGDKHALGFRPAGTEDHLSYAQERLWFLNQLEPDNPFYNVAMALRLDGRLDAGAIQQSFDMIVQRHELLRTTFPAVDGQATLRVDPHRSLKCDGVDLTHLPENEHLAAIEQLANAEA